MTAPELRTAPSERTRSLAAGDHAYLSTDELRPASLAQGARDGLAPALGGRFDSKEFLGRIEASVQATAGR